AGTQIRGLHGADPGARGASDGQWGSGEGSPVCDPARGQTVQHLRPGVLRELDRGALTASPAEVEALPREPGSPPGGCRSTKSKMIAGGAGATACAFTGNRRSVGTSPTIVS